MLFLSIWTPPLVPQVQSDLGVEIAKGSKVTVDKFY